MWRLGLCTIIFISYDIARVPSDYIQSYIFKKSGAKNSEMPNFKYDWFLIRFIKNAALVHRLKDDM